MPSVRAQPERPNQRQPRPIRRTGPRALGLQRRERHTGGPGQPPPGFLGPTVSSHEWIWFWASRKVLDPQMDPRQPPFSGGRGWDYQNPYHQFGVLQSVVDFIYYLPGEIVGVRVMTPFFHRGPEKDAYDAAQARSLSRTIVTKDVYSQNFIRDVTGEAAVRLLIEVLGGRDRLNVMTMATFYPSRIGEIG